MNKLLVSIADFPAQGVAVHETVSAAEFGPAGEDDVAPGPVDVEGRIEEAGGAFTFAGVLSGSFRGPCDRCPKHVEAPFAFRVAWTFLESDPDVSDDEWESGGEATEDGVLAGTYGFSGEVIDLGRAVREEIMLAVPAKFPPLDADLLRCTVCGEDIEALLGVEPEPEKTFDNSGLAALKDMFPNLPKGPEQE